MSRRIELAAALIAAALGLIWLAYEATSLQSLWVVGALAGSGAGPAPGEPISANTTGLYFAGVVLTMICLALGAYLHVVQRLLSGLVLVWLAAGVASVAIPFYLLEPWRFVPVEFIYIAQASIAPWLTPVGVLALVFAWIAAVAGLPVRQGTSRRVTHLPRHQGPETLAAPPAG